MNILPDELIVYIMKFLPLEDILRCECVCARWKKLSQDQTIWKQFVIVYSKKPGQSEVSKRNLHIIETHSQFICCIKLQYIYDYPLLISLLEKCENMISLEIVMCRISKDFAERILQWPRLQKINLKNSILIQSSTSIPYQCDMLIDFNKFHKLTYLALADFGMSTVNFNTLIHCVHLSHLFIDKIRNLALDDIKRIIIAKQDILQSFHIYGDDSVDNSCLYLLSKCTLLKDLGIIRCDKLSDDGLISLGNCKSLCDLTLWNNVQFSKNALLSVFRNPNLYNLNTLSLSRIDCVSPEVVDFISEHYKNLTSIALYQCAGIKDTNYEKQIKYKFKNINYVLS